MSKILIWRTPIPGSDSDILNRTDYNTFYKTFAKNSGYLGCNWGNKVWFQAIYSMIDTPENELTFRTDESSDDINGNYDMVIYPMANFFGEEFCSDTRNLTKAISSIKIPVYIIACGAQAKSYDHLDDLISKIGDPAKMFIDAIYKTGGEFALRGYFTKEFFNRLGYSTAVVTGCPSLFQIGPDLQIRRKEISGDFKPVLNGKIKSFEKILEGLPASEFLAQDDFIDCLYDPDYFDEPGIKKDIRFIRNHSINQAELIAQGRIKMFADTNDWLQYLKNSRFDYSFGTKIHGNIMPILAGIPATVLYIDTRTREMAEFFNIPAMPFDPKHTYSKEDLRAAFEQADYTSFNVHFKERFLEFERFLRDKGIVREINTDNRFFSEDNSTDFEHMSVNHEAFGRYAKRLRMEEPILRLGQWAVKRKKRQKGKR